MSQATTQQNGSSLLVSGVLIIRNGVKLDYPFLESIRSILPICDEFLVVVGDSEDGTRAAVEGLGDPKIRIIDSEWSPLVTPRKCLLAQQTNLGINQARGRWCFSIQGAEVLHERDLEAVRRLMERHVDDLEIEGMLFERLTFWADYGHVVNAYPQLFKYTPRIVRSGIGAHSIRDAMSFAVFDEWSTRGRYPRCIDTGAYLFRYSDVREASVMARKFREAVHCDWKITDAYFQTAMPKRFISRYGGSHPAVMQERVAAFKEQYDEHDPRCRSKLTMSEWQRLVETQLYHRIGLPRLRNSRFKLVGDLAWKTDRPR